MKDLNRHINFILATLVSLFSAPAAFGSTLDVCKTCTYTSVKQAVKKAKSGDTVVVDGGVYKEFGIEVNKPLTLIGQNNPVIDGNYQGQIITVTADNVTIQGLTLKNIKTSYTKDDAAIRVIERSNIRILNNTILNTYFGIYLQNSDHCLIEGNTVIGKDVKGVNESSLGNAIHLW
ncbi:MAG: right-handed parallel beta-helix repeat-containing protein, partial [Pontibacter sp.]|nr:right-handed parallel beta-helix repeat-containing protein [Pontibacter sp.]